MLSKKEFHINYSYLPNEKERDLVLISGSSSAYSTPFVKVRVMYVICNNVYVIICEQN